MGEDEEVEIGKLRPHTDKSAMQVGGNEIYYYAHAPGKQVHLRDKPYCLPESREIAEVALGIAFNRMSTAIAPYMFSFCLCRYLFYDHSNDAWLFYYLCYM